MLEGVANVVCDLVEAGELPLAPLEVNEEFIRVVGIGLGVKFTNHATNEFLERRAQAELIEGVLNVLSLHVEDRRGKLGAAKRHVGKAGEAAFGLEVTGDYLEANLRHQAHHIAAQTTKAAPVNKA